MDQIDFVGPADSMKGKISIKLGPNYPPIYLTTSLLTLPIDHTQPSFVCRTLVKGLVLLYISLGRYC